MLQEDDRIKPVTIRIKLNDSLLHNYYSDDAQVNIIKLLAHRSSIEYGTLNCSLEALIHGGILQCLIQGQC